MKRTLFSILALYFLISPGGVSGGPNASTNETAPESKPVPANLGAFLRMHYVNRTRAFQEQNQTLRHVVLLGDSITEGFDVARHFPGHCVNNRGIGGDVIGNELPADDPRGVLKRLDNSVFQCGATDVFLLIGINDFNGGHAVDAMEQGYRELLRRIREGAPAARLHVQSVLPTRGNFARHNAPVRDFNQRLQKLAAEFDCAYLDLHQRMSDERGELKAEFTNDGLHLTDAAYLAWRDEIRRTLGWK